MLVKYIWIVSCLTVCFSQNMTINNTQKYIHIPRVVNGRSAKHGEVPYQVALKALVTRSKLLYGTYCGAVIVGPTKLITAAHCILSKKAIRNSHFKPTGYVEARRLKEKYAVAGNLDNRDIVAHNDSITKGQWRLLSCAYYPIKYMFPKHDIAITYTRKRFYFNDYVAPVPIASVDAEYLGPCLVSGYGRISAVGKASRLILAYLDIMPTSTCNKVHQRNMNSFICTSSKVSDVAQGDSGGPLVCSYTSDPEEGKYGLLVGIVSGHRPYAGSFFTRISKYKYFLAKDKSNSYCYISRVSSSLVMILIYIFLILICFI